MWGLVVKLAFVCGTRPEVIKLAPVIYAARARGLDVEIATTGQHPELAARALAEMELAADVAGEPIPGELADGLASVVTWVSAYLRGRPIDAVVVHGDTTSALGAALAAKYGRIPLAHVEAGLRTGDDRAPFPEEIHRRLIDAIADRNYAPTVGARDHLLREGVPPERIAVTGNPIVDAVRHVLRGRRLEVGAHVLVTAHRRENLAALGSICDAVARIARHHPVRWPVHPNPEVQAEVRARLAGVSGVERTGPLPYPALLESLATARLVLTDSGGVQEEAACLGRPTLVLRDVTERPEVLDSGVVALVGTEADAIEARAAEWLADPPSPAPGPSALGDGAAGVRIAGLLHAWGGAGGRERGG